MGSKVVRSSIVLSVVSVVLSLGPALPSTIAVEAAGESADVASVDAPIPVPFAHHRQSCSAPAQPGYARCHAHVNTDIVGRRTLGRSATGAITLPSGYGPSDLWKAYGLNPPRGAPGSGPTVAIIDALDNPTAEADLAVFRTTYGLGACTSLNGCFRKIDQNGGDTSQILPDRSWGEEIALDIDMVSAICPNCKILLVEAYSASFVDLGVAVTTAASLGAVAISNSYGTGEWDGNGELYYGAPYNHPGIAVTASTGDSGYGVQFPATLQWVTAVGGTSLIKDSSTRGFSEQAWSGAGSGCSAYIPKPTWQKDPGCPRRAVADVSAVADPGTGVAVYDTNQDDGWLVFGGTSVASPIIASVYALRGNTASLNYGSYSYSHTGSLYDVRSGSNGSCSPSYLCTALPHYDGPTGNGTPHGLNAF
jgi:subtilase family serine protease